MSKNLKVKAFTLLEALVALLVLSGGVLVFQAMTQLLSSELHQQETISSKSGFCLPTNWRRSFREVNLTR